MTPESSNGRVLITIPVDLFATLMVHCDTSSNEDNFMMSGLIIENKKQVAILCDFSHAYKFIAWAASCVADADRLIAVQPEQNVQDLASGEQFGKRGKREGARKHP